MFKKLITLFMAFLVGIQPMTSSAADLGAAFNSLLPSGSAASVTAPGRYTAGARNIFIGGGVEVRFPSSNVSLFSIAPPSFSAGCQGISAHFGGFSFISGKEIETLVKNIAAGAPGMVVNLVIKALCPMCEAVLQNMQKLAQFAAKGNLDSCRIAGNLSKMLVDGVISATGAKGTEGLVGECGANASSVNLSADFAAAQNSACATMNGAMKTMSGIWGDMEKSVYGPNGTPAGTDTKAGTGTPTAMNTSAERCSIGAGNCAWLVLTEIYPSNFDKKPPVNLDGDTSLANIGKRLILMNLLGTQLMAKGASCGTAATASAGTASAGSAAADFVPIISVKCLPQLEVKEAVGLFMCGNQLGTTGLADSSVWKDYCAALFSKAGATNKSVDVLTSIMSKTIMDCDSTTGDTSDARYQLCDTLVARPIKDLSKVITGKGFLLEVQDLLQEAVSRVRSNRAMASDETGRRIIDLMNIAPYPLYQAVNAAAVYPEAGGILVDSLSVLVADHLAYAYFQKFLRFAADGNFAGSTVSPAMYDRLANGMKDLRMEADVNKAQMAKTIASQQAVMEQIRQVNTVIQQSVMTEQMLNLQKYANTINTSAAEPTTSKK